MTDPRVKPDATRVAIKRLAQSTIGPQRQGVDKMKEPSALNKMYNAMADMVPITSTLRQLKKGNYGNAALDAAMGGIPAGGMFKKLKALAKNYGLTSKVVAGHFFIGAPYTHTGVKGLDEVGQEWIRVSNIDELKDAAYGLGEDLPRQYVPQAGEVIRMKTPGSSYPRTMESEIRKAGWEGEHTFRPDTAIVNMAKKLRKEPEQDLTARMKQMLNRLGKGEELKDIKPKRKLPSPRSQREFREDIKGVENTPLKKKK